MFIYRQHLFFLQFSFIIIISIRLSKILFLPNWIELKWNDLEQTKQNKTKQIFWLIENYIIQFVCQKNAYFHSVVRQFGNWGHSERRERKKIYRSSLKKKPFFSIMVMMIIISRIEFEFELNDRHCIIRIKREKTRISLFESSTTTTTKIKYGRFFCWLMNDARHLSAIQ